jgi:hypothetical protein
MTKSADHDARAAEATTPTAVQTIPLPIVGLALHGFATVDALHWRLMQRHADVLDVRAIATRGLERALSAEMNLRAHLIVDAHHVESSRVGPITTRRGRRA